MNRVSAPEPAQPTYDEVTSSDGTLLSYIPWLASSRCPSETTAIVLHGIGLHSEPYKALGEGLNRLGIDVYALDARGHGRSDGKRGRVPNTMQLRSDIDAVIAAIRRRAPDSRIFLLGESMGAAFALGYMSTVPSELAGAVLLAPPLKIAVAQLFKGATLLRAAYGLFRPNTGVISLIDSRLEECTRSKWFIDFRRSDALSYRKVSIRYLLGIANLTKRAKAVARHINIPLLVMAGSEDRLVNLSAIKQFVNCVASSDKELVIFEGVPHTLVWDTATPQIIRRIGVWLTEHSECGALAMQTAG